MSRVKSGSHKRSRGGSITKGLQQAINVERVHLKPPFQQVRNFIHPCPVSQPQQQNESKRQSRKDKRTILRPGKLRYTTHALDGNDTVPSITHKEYDIDGTYKHFSGEETVTHNLYCIDNGRYYPSPTAPPPSRTHAYHKKNAQTRQKQHENTMALYGRCSNY